MKDAQDNAQKGQKDQKSRKKMKASTLRTIVMFAVLIVVAVGYFTHMGIGNLSAIGIDVFSVICPLGYLESLLASKTFVPRALISFVAVVALVLVLGRVFCSWICPMPFLQKALPGLDGKKRKAKRAAKAAAQAAAGAADSASEVEPASAETAANATPQDGATQDASDQDASTTPAKKGAGTFKLDSRFGVLLGALGSAAIFGFPVFCLICPVGLTFATVYLIMRLFAFGEATWTVLLVPAILLIEVLFLRKWCSKICPLGALMSLISAGNKTLRPTINNETCLETSKGASCQACAKSCPEQINIREPEISETAASNCTKCRECADHCPVHAITFPLLPKKGK